MGHTFINGYLSGLETPDFYELTHSLDQVEPEWRGFAYEGAAMALALLDGVTPWRASRAAAFAAGPAARHVYMVHVGMGWAWARLHKRVSKARARLDPLLGWLAVDGLGFHEGYFRPEQSYVRQLRRRSLIGYEVRVFDQGLGRALWFVEAADARQVAVTIGAFPAERRADLWSGIGLASAYAGGARREDLGALREAAGEHASHLAQGAAFAAAARERAGNPTSHTDLACETFCGGGAPVAAATTRRALDGLVGDPSAYDEWRRRIRSSFERSEGEGR